jgi:hypothetical protein
MNPLVASADRVWHNDRDMFRGSAITLVLISVGIHRPTRTG